MTSKLRQNLFFLIPAVLLFLFWIIFSLILTNRFSFSVISYITDNKISSQPNISRTQEFQGEFKAGDDYLGLIAINLIPSKVSKDEKGELIFRFKEKNDANWNFIREYPLPLFDSQAQFTFGIPVIRTSRGRVYRFELSLKGDSKKILKMKDTGKFIIGYQYPKSEIVPANLKTIRFFSNKILTSFIDIEFLSHAALYLPAFVLLYFLIIRMRLIKFKNNPGIRTLTLSFLKIDLKLAAILLWLVLIIKSKFKSNVSFFLSFLAILFWMAILPFGFSTVNNSLNIVSFAFMVIGATQLLFEKDEK